MKWQKHFNETRDGKYWAVQEEEGVSIRPSDATEGMNLIDDADVEITGAKVVIFDFGGKAARVCVAVEMKTEDGTEATEFLSAGDTKFFRPSANGRRIVPIGERGTIVNSTKYMHFMTSLVNLGWPEERMSQDVDVIVGTRCHVKRKASPKSWSGINRGEGEREATTFEATAIHAYPWDKGKGKTAAKPAAGKSTAQQAARPNGKGAAGAASSAGGDDALDEELGIVVQKVLAEAGGSVSKKKLVPAVFQVDGIDPAKKKLMVKRVFEDDFLIAGMSEGKWSWDGETLEASA
jgi:hypothetical protein